MAGVKGRNVHRGTDPPDLTDKRASLRRTTYLLSTSPWLSHPCDVALALPRRCCRGFSRTRSCRRTRRRSSGWTSRMSRARVVPAPLALAPRVRSESLRRPPAASRRADELRDAPAAHARVGCRGSRGAQCRQGAQVPGAVRRAAAGVAGRAAASLAEPIEISDSDSD